ncbi:hypothetical protein HAX54_025028 [Datura stramonium]|uniref:Uncharacterized protein n=1 Tax=Datura stramonium TaxID=4076 RepID=A0ABS8UYX1_DATST|nr:hypothetical protein [Datura stramonium]
MQQQESRILLTTRKEVAMYANPVSPHEIDTLGLNVVGSYFVIRASEFANSNCIGRNFDITACEDMDDELESSNRVVSSRDDDVWRLSDKDKFKLEVVVAEQPKS